MTPGTWYVAEHIFTCLLGALALGAILFGLIPWLLKRGKSSNLEAEWSRKLGLVNDEKTQLAGQLKTSDGAVAEWKGKYGTLDGQFKTMQAKFAELTGKVPALEAAVAGWVAKSAAWDSDRAKLQADLKTCADARGKLDAEVADWVTKGKAWDTQRAAMDAEWNKKFAAANDEKARIQASLTALQGEHGTLKTSFADVQNKIGPLEGVVAGWAAKSHSWDSDRNRLMAELHQATGIVSHRDTEIKDLKAQLGSAQAQIVSTKAQLDKAVSDDKADDSAYEKTIADLRLKLSALDQEKAKHEANEKDLTARINSLQAQLQKAIADDKADDSAYEKTIADLRAKLAAADGDRTQLAARFKESETHLHDWRTRFATLEGDHGKLRHQLTDVSSKIGPLEGAVAGWVAKSTAWDSDRAKLQLDAKNTSDARLKLEGEIRDLTGRLNATEAQLRKAVADDKADDAAYEKTIADLRGRITVFETERAKLQGDVNKIAPLEASVAGWAAKSAAWETDRSKLQSDLKTTGDARLKLESDVRDLTVRTSNSEAQWKKVIADDKAAYEKTIVELRGRLTTIEAERGKFQIDLKTLTDARAKLEADLKAATDARTRLEGQLNDWTTRAKTWEAREADLNHRLRATDAQLQKVIADDKAAAAVQQQTVTDLRGRMTALESEWKARYGTLEAEHGQCATRYAALEAKFAAAPVAMAAAAAASSGKTVTAKRSGGDIEDIEGIGPVFGGKMRKIGIYWIHELLEEGKTPEGRAEIVEKTGIESRLVLKWVNHADLLRIEGVTPNWAELLEASGVDTVKELQHRVPAHLQKKMEEVNPTNGRGRYAPTVPDLQMVTRWVEQAKKMEPKLTY